MSYVYVQVFEKGRYMARTNPGPAPMMATLRIGHLKV